MDFGLPRDLSSPSATGDCGTHHLVDVPLTRIELVDPPDALRYGRIIRLRVVYAMSSCDEPGGIGMSFHVGDATDTVTINAHLWRPVMASANCVGSEEFNWIMPLTDGFVRSNPRIVARDGAAGGTATLEFAIAARPRLACDHQVALDQPCQLDCECERVLGGAGKCIPIAPDHGVCELICSNDGECGSMPRPRCDEGASPPMTCRPALAGGACGHPCGHHQSCTAGACRPNARPTADSSCQCDGDCRESRFCAPGGICRIACKSVTDCPGQANYCGDRCGYP